MAGGLLKAFDPFRPLGLAKDDAVLGEQIFDGGFNEIADEFINGVPMTGKRPAQEPLIQKHRIGCAKIGKWRNTVKAGTGVCLVEPMDHSRIGIVRAIAQELTGGDDERPHALTGHTCWFDGFVG